MGGSFTGWMLTVKLLLAESRSSSVTVTVISTFPNAFGAGVAHTVRFEPLPPSTMFVSGTRLASEDCAVSTRLVAGVVPSPIRKRMAAVGVSSNVL